MVSHRCVFAPRDGILDVSERGSIRLRSSSNSNMAQSASVAGT